MKTITDILSRKLSFFPKTVEFLLVSRCFFCVLVIGLTLASHIAMAELTPITLEHDSIVSSVSFSPNGKLSATGSLDDTAKVWAPNTIEIPTLTQPPNGAEFADTLPELKWEKAPNALYQVQVAKDKGFSLMALEKVTGAESLKVSMLLHNRKEL